MHSNSVYILQVCGLEFDRKDIMMNKLVATTLESKFHLFDVRTQHPEKGFASLSEKVKLSTKYILYSIVCSYIWNMPDLLQHLFINLTS